MLDLIFVALYNLSIRFLQVDILDGKQLLSVIKNLVDLKERTFKANYMKTLQTRA